MTDLVVIHSRDPDFSLLMGHILAGAGFAPLIAEDAGALGASEISRTLAIIIDCTGVAQETLAFCKAIRQASVSAPPPLIAMVPAQQAQDVLQLLSSGIDQVFMRPVSPEHLLMCLRAIRPGGSTLTDGETRSAPGIRRYGNLEIDDDRRMLRSAAAQTHLSPIEFRLLRRLLEEPGRVRDRDDLVTAAWPGQRHVDHRTVDVHIGKLRRHLRAVTGHDVIQTIRSNGFVIDPESFFGQT